ncbi:MAG: hypothetical protein IPO95_15055 [Rhodanobacteraceae bacterium]|nr:hypothetical protein [Rhodanobacteraceae bacterium]MBL0041489.1 hypothetical protein [Xanthomonadales bacterium]MBP6078151.1 hypothetical protein [Xanthomonadales bacterium]
MANRRLRIATSLTGLLVVANSGLLPGDIDGGLISAAYAQDDESWDEDGEDAGDDSEFTDEDDAAEFDGSEDTDEDSDAADEDDAEELADGSEDAGDDSEAVDEEEESSDDGSEVASDDSQIAEPAEAPKPVEQPIAAQETPKPAAVNGSDPVRASTRAFLARFFKGHSVRDDENFFELGYVNSLLALQLVAFCEKEFGIEVEDADLNIGNFTTIDNIAAFVANKRK